MRWSVDRFAAELKPAVMQRYRAENDWYKRWPPSDQDAITSARRLYAAANTNALGFLLLGDAKIRSGDLLFNFGLTSANGLSDAREAQAIADVFARRQGLAQGTNQPAVKALGPGSILNDKDWTPLMNDAYILGGVHDRQDFHWAEEGLAQHSFLSKDDFLKNRDVFGAAAPNYQAALRRDEAYYKDKLLHYLLGRSNFWAGGVVRIFARELIGLKRFGYRFVVRDQRLSFAAGTGGADATFTEYLDALREVGFDKGNAAAINAALGEFLFDDRTALSGLSKGSPTGFVKPTLNEVSKPKGWPS